MFQVQVLDPSKWPINMSTPWLEGEAKLQKLCLRLRIPYDAAKTSLRDYMDQLGGSNSLPDAIKQLNDTIATIPVTSADAERGFSTMNVICTSLRSSLKTPRLAGLMFISLLGPQLRDFNPRPYVLKWLSAGHRAATDNQSRKCVPKKDDERRYEHMANFF